MLRAATATSFAGLSAKGKCKTLCSTIIKNFKMVMAKHNTYHGGLLRTALWSTGELVPAGTVGPWHVCPPGTSSFPALCPLLMRSWHASSIQKTPDHMELWLAPQSSQGRAWFHQSMTCDCTKGTADNMQSPKTIIFC